MLNKHLKYSAILSICSLSESLTLTLAKKRARFTSFSRWRSWL